MPVVPVAGIGFRPDTGFFMPVNQPHSSWTISEYHHQNAVIQSLYEQNPVIRSDAKRRVPMAIQPRPPRAGTSLAWNVSPSPRSSFTCSSILRPESSKHNRQHSPKRKIHSRSLTHLQCHGKSTNHRLHCPTFPSILQGYAGLSKRVFQEKVTGMVRCCQESRAKMRSALFGPGS